MDFIIQKVNNRDVSNLSHTDAFRVFQEAEEPIMVQVLRRKKDAQEDSLLESHSTDEPKEDMSPKATQSTQTDISLTGVEWAFGGGWSPDLSDCGSPEGDYVFPGDLPQSISQYMEQEVDIEEILLERESPKDLLGLTLYYTHSANSTELSVQTKEIKEETSETPASSKDPTDSGGKSETGEKVPRKTTEVLVSQIEPGSLAAKDGRLRIGDQILQINGEELTDKEQTQKIFQSSLKKFALIVSRTQYYDEDDLQEGVVEDLVHEEEDTEVLDANSEFTATSFPSSKTEEEPPMKQILETTIEEKEESSSPAYSSSNSTVSSKSSIDKLKKVSFEKQFSPKTVSPPPPKELNDTYRDPLPIPIKNRPAIPVPCGTDSEHIYESIPEQSEDEPIYCLPYESTNPPKLPPLQKQDGTGKSSDSSRSSGSRQERQNKPCVKGKTKSPSDERDSSSAYNTEESTGSNPKQGLEMSLGVDSALRLSTLRLSSRTNHASMPKNIPYKPLACSTCPKCVEESKLKSHHPCPVTNHCKNVPYASHDQTKRKDKNYVSFAHNQTLYTNPANLNQTIWLQQQLFRQALVKRQQSRETEYESIKPQDFNKTKDSRQSEWKVKIRPDGTRYITHRPVRNKILKERANRINEDRIGLTTDDDAMSEIKVGRYWSREERKKQYERERQRKKHQEARKQTRPLVMPTPEQPPQLTKWVPVLEVNTKGVSETLCKKPMYPPPHYPHSVHSPVAPQSHFSIPPPPPPRGMLSVTTV